MRAAIEGTEIYFDVEGAGLVPDGEGGMREKLACFVLHGGPGVDHGYFKPWLSPLSELFQLIYVDHRGNGRSAPVALETCRLPQMADDLEALRRHLGLPAVGVIGHSYGGFLALTYAVRHPDSVAALFPVGTASSHRFRESASKMLDRIGSPEQLELAPKLWRDEVRTDEAFRDWWRVMTPLYFHRYDPEIGAQLVDGMIPRPEVCGEVLSKDLPQYDVEDDLVEVDAPTLVLVGRDDWVTPVQESQLIVDRIPGAELAVFERSGHYPFIEEQEAFADAFRDFVGRRL